MGKTAALPAVQKMSIDTKEGKTQGHFKRAWLLAELCPNTLIERRREGKDMVGKYTNKRDNCSLERIVKQNPFKNMGEIHRVVSQYFKKNHHTQTYARHGFQQL